MAARHRYHRPVMPQECLAFLAPEPGALIVDGTLGAGGHARLLLEASGPDGRLLGVDQDPDALEEAAHNLAAYGDRVVLRQGNFGDLAEIAQQEGFKDAHCVLLDLGVSSHQLDQAERGFSFRRPGPLDMRMGKEGPTLAQLLEEMEVDELSAVLRRYGEVPRAGVVAHRIKENLKEMESTADLARIVEGAAGAFARRRRIHPATLVFQALRILVNQELEVLDRFLATLPDPLGEGGRVAVISYHSLEDRRVKKRFNDLRGACTCPPGMPVCGCGRDPQLKVLTSGAAKPDDVEVQDNPRARSARLRAAMRITTTTGE